MTRVLRADLDAYVLSACGLIVALGLLLHVWSRLQVPS